MILLLVNQCAASLFHYFTLICRSYSLYPLVAPVIPPSTTNFWPVIYPAWSLERNTAAFATSNELPILPIGTAASRLATRLATSPLLYFCARFFMRGASVKRKR